MTNNDNDGQQNWDALKELPSPWARHLPRTAAEWIDHDLRDFARLHDEHRDHIDELLADHRAHVRSIEHFIDAWTTVYLWALLARVSPAIADQAAEGLALACEAGDGFGEWAWQWAQEHAMGVPLTIPGAPLIVNDTPND